MRSAGCIVNDILDRKYDILVERTKNRPIASGKISIKFRINLCNNFMLNSFFNFNTI